MQREAASRAMLEAILTPRLAAAELELTTKCPHRCITCGSAAGEARPRELSLARWLELLHELRHLGCRRLTLLGGEPLCFDGWREVARTATELSMATELVTSGFGVDPDLARDAKRSGLMSVTVSVDGTEAVHDRQRCLKGSFRQALAAIALFDAAGLHVGVTTQINRLTLPCLDELAPILQDAGALGWQVQLTLPIGRAKTAGIALMPDQASELYAALPRLLARRGLHPVLTDSLGYFSQDDVLLRSLQGGQARPWLGCFAGLRHVGIASDGGVKGCLALSDDFLEGNVETEALAAIWADPARFPYTRSFDKAKLSGPCAECTQGELCRGGCTAVATAYEGRPGVFRHCFRLVASGPAKRTQLG